MNTAGPFIMNHLAFTPEIARQICMFAGIKYHDFSTSQLADKISERCSQLELVSVAAYLQWLQHPEHLAAERIFLSHLLTSQETYFLRDPGLMNVLRTHLIPERVRQRAAEKKLNIWSVGCSTGEEPYTLSILAEETVPDIARWKIDILGSDISSSALNMARQALYRKWSFRGCSPHFMQRYFTPEDGTFRLMDKVRQRVRFEQLDMVGDPYPSFKQGMSDADIILCRNVFVYLDEFSIQNALKKLTSCLAEGGFFICAPGELHSQSHPHLLPRIFPQALAYEKNSFTSSRAELPPSPVEALPRPDPQPRPPAQTPSITSPERRASELNEPAPTIAQAWVMANRGLTHEAERLCQSYIRAYPLDPEAYYLQAVLNLAKGALGLARQELRHVLYLDPGFAVAYSMLAEIYLSDNQPDAAAQACKQGLAALKTVADDVIVPYLSPSTMRDYRQYLLQLSGLS